MHEVRKGYIEPNVINCCRRAGWTGATLKEHLYKRGLSAHFGIHGVYELTRGFLSGSTDTEAQSNFQILEELDPVYEPTPVMLYRQEVQRLRTSALVVPVLDELNRVSTKQQVMLMAAGKIEDEARKFVGLRESQVSIENPRLSAQNLQAMRNAVTRGQRRPRTIEEAMISL